MTVVAERVIDYFGDTRASGVVRLFAPFNEGENWRGKCQIAWPGFERDLGAAGEDSWQALQLTMQLVAVEISSTDDFQHRRLGFFGERVETRAELNEWLGLRPMRGFE